MSHQEAGLLGSSYFFFEDGLSTDNLDFERVGFVVVFFGAGFSGVIFLVFGFSAGLLLTGVF